MLVFPLEESPLEEPLALVARATEYGGGGEDGREGLIFGIAMISSTSGPQ